MEGSLRIQIGEEVISAPISYEQETGDLYLTEGTFKERLFIGSFQELLKITQKDFGLFVEILP